MRSLLLLTLLALGATACPKSGPVETTSPPAPAENPMDELIGTWTYAEDPTGAVPSEDLYRTSRITFGADGSYAFQLEDDGMALTGTWSLRQTTDEGYLVDTAYGGGRTNLLHLEVRRDGAAVVGFVVREGEERVGGRYYQR